jgi:hypothetical protein
MRIEEDGSGCRRFLGRRQGLGKAADVDFMGW